MRAFFLGLATMVAAVCAPAAGIGQPIAPRAIAEARKPGLFGGQMRDLIAKLSPRGQQVFRTQWLTVERESLAQRRDATRAAEDQVFATMALEPFDADALRHAYSDQRRAQERNQRQRQEQLVNVLKLLSPTDRKIVVDELRAIRDRTAGSQGHQRAQ